MQLSVSKLSYSIEHTQILKEVSLQVNSGEFVGLIGPNGCGKSTLLKNIYKTCRPQRDVVYINGRDVMTMKPRAMAQEVSVLAQENSIEFDVEVLEMVMYGRYSHQGFWKKEKKADVEICKHYLKEAGLEGYEHRSFLSLSGGEKQRVLLARALAQESRLIVLDEPTNHLDVRFQYLLMQTLKQQDITVFSSIHDLNVAAMYCDRILLMNKGKIVDAGTPGEVLTEENILKVFGVHAQITVNDITGKLQIYYLPDYFVSGDRRG